MSLRYKIMAAVIGITVVVLTLVLAVILWELVSTSREFVEFDWRLRENTSTWIIHNRSALYRENSPVLQLPFLLDVVYVPGEDARGTLEVFKLRSGDLDEDRVRELVRQSILQKKRVRDGNSYAVPDRTDRPHQLPQGGTYFTLDIPSFSPLEPLQRVYLVMLVGIVLIIVVIYVVLSRAVIRPIERLERAAKRIAKGDYSRPVPRAGREDEFDTLVDAFNRMMAEAGSYRAHLEEREQDARQHALDAEKNLVIAQRLTATGQLASGIAHEVNNPLAGMLNAARRLLRDPEVPRAKQEEYLELITDGLLRVQETVKKILQFTPHKVAPRAVSIETVLKRALALAHHRIEKEGMEVFLDLPAETRVFGDPFELQQVILNILINAMDAIGEAGRRGEITIRGQVDDGTLRLSLTDNGCGMEEEHLSRAFDLFYTSKEVGEGTGLGLSIAHNVIQNHGGSIRMSSSRDDGTTVEITLPLLTGED